MVRETFRMRHTPGRQPLLLDRQRQERLRFLVELTKVRISRDSIWAFEYSDFSPLNRPVAARAHN